MLFFTSLLLLDYSEKFYYTTGKYIEPRNVDIKDFESWKTTDFSFSSKEIHIPAGTELQNGARLLVEVPPNSDIYDYVKFVCTSIGNVVDGAKCYTDVIDKNDDYKSPIFANHGETVIQKAFKNIHSEKVIFTIFLYNTNPTMEAVFGLPVIEYIKRECSSLDTIKKDVDGHKNMEIEKCHVSRELGDIFLNTMPLLNAYKPPKQLNYYNLGIKTTTEEYAKIILLANATHIVAFNILQEDYMHCWHVNLEDDLMTFQMHMIARNSTGADISYILWRINTTSWTDAVEHWHQEFPAIYNKQTAGWGLWAPFTNLNNLFPDSNDELDVFHVAFQWGSSHKTKNTVPNWCYIEPTMIHLDIPYHADTVIEDLKKCEYDQSLEKSESQKLELKEKCEIVLDSAARYDDYSLQVKPENQPWNVGMYAPVFFDGKARDYYLKNLDKSFIEPIEKNYSFRYAGVALDSFGNFYGTHIDEENGYTPGKDYIPYYLVDKNKKPILPFFAGLFGAVKIWRERSPRGVLINGNNIMPELLKNNANIGNEIQIGDGDLGYITNPKGHLNAYWQSRYAVGSKSVTFIDTTDIRKSAAYREDYFSLMASLGSPAGFASPGLWQTKEMIDSLRPHYTRWMPALNESLNGNIFYANNLGIVNMTLSEDKQVPQLDDNDLSTVSLWCKPREEAVDGLVDCYAIAFLGYCGPHSNGKDFHREARLEIEGLNKKCLFAAEGMTCIVDNDNVDVSIHGIPSHKTYRSAIIKFQRKLREGYPDYYTFRNNSNNGISTATIICISIAVIVALILVALLILYLFRSRQKEDEKESMNLNINV